MPIKHPNKISNVSLYHTAHSSQLKTEIIYDFTYIYYASAQPSAVIFFAIRLCET